MEKAQLTQEQIDALEIALRDRQSAVNVVRTHMNGMTNNVCYGWSADRVALNQLDLDTVIRALYIGYERKLTKEELVKEYYRDQFVNTPINKQDKATSAIIKTLNFLGVQIEGVNI